MRQWRWRFFCWPVVRRAARPAEVPEKEKVEQVGVNREEILSRIRAAGFHQDSTERKITLTVGGKSVSGPLRMVQGRRTWINISVLGITFARAMFTPDSLQYYERVAKTTFQGRWEELHRLSPVLSALDYAVVENLLCGRAAFPLSVRDFVSGQGSGGGFPVLPSGGPQRGVVFGDGR